jgi:hypothetical protein
VQSRAMEKLAWSPAALGPRGYRLQRDVGVPYMEWDYQST